MTTYGSMENAIRYAEAKHLEYNDSKYANQNPCTTVYRLVRQLLGQDEELNQELISKIKYLNELNIPIVDNNGKLHEIFSMSNIDLLQKYGVSLEDLVTKYYIPLEEKKVL